MTQYHVNAILNQKVMPVWNSRGGEFSQVKHPLKDLPKLLNSIASSADITVGEKSIICLLYADDLVIFSKSAKGLQNILNKLEPFCDYADLHVNLRLIFGYAR